jgi:hypothetical protein
MLNLTQKIKVTLVLLSFLVSPLMQSFAQADSPAPENRKIQIALIMDTSGSMEGLIEQAKSQLWGMVSELTKATYNGQDPMLEIALYEYGNDGRSSSNGYIYQISPLVSDLDGISASLFALSTNGGQEYCGMVIQKSIKELEWSTSEKDIKMKFIAGNEPFTQGPVNYQTACGNARGKDIIINTIHCGDYETGVNGQWKSGALIGGGDYMAIEQNKKTIYVATPYDDRINELSLDLNKTYVYYGAHGNSKKQEQLEQDANAESYSKSNLASRNSIKASKFYKNSSWDLVDAYEEKTVEIAKIEKSSLPPALQNKSTAELEKYVQQQLQTRNNLKQQIEVLNTQRGKYLASQSTSETESLESSMVKSLKKQAHAKNYSW